MGDSLIVEGTYLRMNSLTYGGMIVTVTSTLPRPITEYQAQSVEELYRRTVAAKQTLGERVMILGHN